MEAIRGRSDLSLFARMLVFVLAFIFLGRIENRLKIFSFCLCRRRLDENETFDKKTYFRKNEEDSRILKLAAKKVLRQSSDKKLFFVFQTGPNFFCHNLLK